MKWILIMTFIIIVVLTGYVNNSVHADDKLTHDELINYYRTEAKLGNAEAQYELGQLYYQQRVYSQKKQQLLKSKRNQRLSSQSRTQSISNNNDEYYKLKNYGNRYTTYNLHQHSGRAKKAYTTRKSGSFKKQVGKRYYDQAFKWFQKSAMQAYAKAQNKLGLMYEKGQGVSQNDVLAFDWYRKSAEQGEIKAQHRLGLIYSIGKSVEQSYIEAYKWLSLAREGGNTDAIYNRYIFENEMTAAQKEAGTRLAKQWIASQ